MPKQNLIQKIYPNQISHNLTSYIHRTYYAFKHNIYDLNFIDTSEITDMSLLFSNCMHNFDVSSWDVSNVTNMGYMFYHCKNFNCDLSNWNVSKVKNMNYMFNGCTNFNCDLSDWDISNMTRWKNTFGGCYKMAIPVWYKKLVIYRKK